MDDIIGIFVVIGIIVATVGKSKKRAGQLRTNKPGQASIAPEKPAHASMAKRIPTKAVSVQDMTPEDMTPEDMTPQSMQAPMEARLSDATKALLARLDVQGNMEEKHPGTESLPRVETSIAPRIKAVEKQETPFETVYRKEPVACACGVRFVDTAHMREAVVMAEILDKPVSLRPRHMGR